LLLAITQNVEQLISLNEGSQELCSVYQKLKHSEVSLAEGQRRVRQIPCGDDEPPSASHASTAVQSGRSHAQSAGGDIDLLGMGDYSPQRSPHPAQVPLGQAQAQAQVQPAQPQTAIYPSHPLHNPELPVPYQPQSASLPVQQAAHAAPVRIPPPGQGSQRLHAHPISKPAAAEQVITPAGGDPFAPDALDALFSAAPAQQSAKSGTASAKVGQQQDPFSQPKADPFSPAALDALFDTPKPAPMQGESLQWYFLFWS
jgi:hypothetical protein